MALISINDLCVNAIIGTLDDERIHRQKLIISVKFEYDANDAAKNDDLFASVDYSAVEKAVVQCVEKSSFFLLEALTAAIAREVLAFPRVLNTEISIAKPKASSFGALITYTENFCRENRP